MHANFENGEIILYKKVQDTAADQLTEFASDDAAQLFIKWNTFENDDSDHPELLKMVNKGHKVAVENKDAVLGPILRMI